MDVIYTWIKNIIVYMILNTIIMNLLGNSSYKKYVSIVSGMILVLIVVSPLMNVMELEDNLDYYLEANDFAVETSDFQNDLQRMEEKQSDAIFSEYQEKIKKQVDNMLREDGIYLVTFDINLDRDITSETFGDILRMDITASVEPQESSVMSQRLSVEVIDKIEIKISKEEEASAVYVPSPMEINIKKRLSDFYNIEPNNINVSIQGG